MALYAVAILLPDEVEKELDRLRGEFGRQMVYIPLPHITLAYPFTPATDIQLIIEKLGEVAARTAKFPMLLEGFDYFEIESNAAYVAVRTRKPVIDLHYEINSALEGLVEDEYNGRFNLESFVPHMTIGADIPDEVFPEVKERLEGLEMRYETEIDSFPLLARGEDGVWGLVRVFEFGR